jgi:AcrR family transcriptional regulator
MYEADSSTLKLKNNRGRPRGDAKAQVVQRLLDTTEVLLLEYSQVDLTERKIAAEAGVHYRMINYYFNNKDGLIFGVIARYCDVVSDRLKAIETIDLSSPDVTRQIFKILVTAYFAKPWLARILASELARNHSEIKEFYVKRYGPQGQGHFHIHRVFERLVKAGVYAPTVDTNKAALGIFLISAAPAIVAPLSGHSDLDLPEFVREDWINYVADLFDLQLRAGQAKSPGAVRASSISKTPSLACTETSLRAVTRCGE